MATSKIYINSLETTGQRAFSIKLAERRQLQFTLAAGASYDATPYASLEELNRNADIQALLDAGTISVTVTAGTDDIADMPTEADIRARTGFPTISFLTGETVSAGTPAAKTATGTNLLNGQTRASTTFGSGTSSVLIEANRPGEPGNLITVVLASGAGEAISAGSAPAGELAVARTVTVTSNDGVSTGNSIATLINAHAVLKLLVRATGGGAGTSLGYASQTLAGGTGAGFKAYIGGLQQEMTNKVTDTSMPMQTVALTGMANGDMASLVVTSDDTVSFPLSVRVVT